MYICTYIYVYVCVYVRHIHIVVKVLGDLVIKEMSIRGMYTGIYMHIYVCIFICVFIYVYIYIYVYVYIRHTYYYEGAW